MKRTVFLIFLFMELFNISQAQVSFGLDLGSNNFKLTSEKYYSQNYPLLGVNLNYYFKNHYGVHADFRYISEGAVLNNKNLDINFLQIPLCLSTNFGFDKIISYQFQAGYYLKIPLTVSNNMTKNFINHGITGKFLLFYKLSSNAKCFSGFEISEDLYTSYPDKNLKFDNYGIVFGFQVFPFDKKNKED